MNQSSQKNFQTKRKVILVYFFIDKQQEKDNPSHLQIKELKLDRSMQLQAIRSEMKIFRKVTPVTTHSMNPLILPFLPKPNHQTRFLMQENLNTSSPQGTHCIAIRGDSQNRFQCLTCCETQSC